MLPTALCCLLRVRSPSALRWQLSWAPGTRVKAVQSPRQMEENFYTSCAPPDGAELPLKPGWSGVVLQSPCKGDNSSWSSQE